MERPKAAEGDIRAWGASMEGPQESDTKLDEAAEAATEETQPAGGWGDEEKFEAAESIEEAAAEDDPVYQSHLPEPTQVASDDEETQETEEEVVEGDEYDQLLARVRQGPADTEEKTVEATDSQLQARLAYQQGKLEALEDQIKERTDKPVEPDVVEAPKPQGINYEDPALQAALREAVNDPAKLGPTIAVLVKREAEALIKAEVGEVKENLETVQAEREDREKREEAGTRITTGLQAAYNLGGLEAAIVRDAWENQDSSMLFQYLANGNQSLAMTSQGIVTATLAVARAVERADADQTSDPVEKTQETPVVSGKQRSTVASKRGRDIRKPKKQTTPEEDIRSRIVGTKSRVSKIPFMQ